MKAKIRKTGEIVDVICYGGSPISRSDVLDYVNYIDSQGVEHTEPNHLNYYWDFEPIETTNNGHWQTDDITDWGYYRIHTAIAAMQGLLCAPSYKADRSKLNMVAKDAISIADVLINELKKK